VQGIRKPFLSADLIQKIRYPVEFFKQRNSIWRLWQKLVESVTEVDNTRAAANVFICNGIFLTCERRKPLKDAHVVIAVAGDVPRDDLLKLCELSILVRFCEEVELTSLMVSSTTCFPQRFANHDADSFIERDANLHGLKSSLPWNYPPHVLEQDKQTPIYMTTSPSREKATQASEWEPARRPTTLSGIPST
jgi:hypothetical protein